MSYHLLINGSRAFPIKSDSEHLDCVGNTVCKGNVQTRSVTTRNHQNSVQLYNLSVLSRFTLLNECTNSFLAIQSIGFVLPNLNPKATVPETFFVSLANISFELILINSGLRTVYHPTAVNAEIMNDGTAMKIEFSFSPAIHWAGGTRNLGIRQIDPNQAAFEVLYNLL